MQDYRQLCIEIFGTDDVSELKKIAKRATPGRKKALTHEQIAILPKLQRQGMTTAQIATHFGISRQTVSKYLNAFSENCTLRINYMHRQKVCTVIYVDFLNQKVQAVNRTDDILMRAFGTIENPTWEQFEYFLIDRCFPATRDNAKQLLQTLGLDVYDPLRIIEKTGGRMAEDHHYMTFEYRKADFDAGNYA